MKKMIVIIIACGFVITAQAQNRSGGGSCPRTLIEDMNKMAGEMKVHGESVMDEGTYYENEDMKLNGRIYDKNKRSNYVEKTLPKLLFLAGAASTEVYFLSKFCLDWLDPSNADPEIQDYIKEMKEVIVDNYLHAQKDILTTVNQKSKDGMKYGRQQTENVLELREYKKKVIQLVHEAKNPSVYGYFNSQLARHRAIYEQIEKNVAFNGRTRGYEVYYKAIEIKALTQSILGIGTSLKKAYESDNDYDAFFSNIK